MPKICKICTNMRKYAKNMHNMQIICNKHAEGQSNAQHIQYTNYAKKYAKNMQKICEICKICTYANNSTSTQNMYWDFAEANSVGETLCNSK